jgi:prepilin-type N-terminal cleavage/methylation domain-containing protein
MKKSLHNAFTLIEVLIVAIIVGVLAATILPQFATSTKDAKMSNLKFNLRTVRSMLETYKEQHAGAYPPAASSADFANQMTQKTDQNTALNPTGGKCGPYIEGSIPINPFNNSSAVVILKGNTQPTGPTGSADGWQYNPANGWFYPNNSEYFQETGSFSDPN